MRKEVPPYSKRDFLGTYCPKAILEKKLAGKRRKDPRYHDTGRQKTSRMDKNVKKQVREN